VEDPQRRGQKVRLKAKSLSWDLIFGLALCPGRWLKLKTFDEYKDLLKGFKWLTPQEAQTAFKPGSTTESLPYAAKETTKFILAQKLIT
jgi:hypothetical protein